MTYIFLSARYANEAKTAAFAQTDGFGEVLVSEADAPELWAELTESGVAIVPYEEPPQPPEPDPVNQLADFLNANPEIKALIFGDQPLAGLIASKG